MAFPRLNIHNVFSSIFIIIIGEISQIRARAFEEDSKQENGEQFIKKVVHGEKLTEKPGYLVFTAPYRLCEGECDDSANNFVMTFPVYVGKKGMDKYKSLFQRDYNNLHSNDPNAPFKKKSSRRPFTLCPTLASTIASTPARTTTTTYSTKTPPTTTTTLPPTTTKTTTTTEPPNKIPMIVKVETSTVCPTLIQNCRRKSKYLLMSNYVKLDLPDEYIFYSSEQNKNDADVSYDEKYFNKEDVSELLSSY